MFCAVYASFPETPIVALTGLATQEEHRRAGAVEEALTIYLVKAHAKTAGWPTCRATRSADRRRQRLLDGKARPRKTWSRPGAFRTTVIPKHAPACSGVDLHGALFPAGTMGGDYFDYLPLDGWRTGAGHRRRDGQGWGRPC